MQHDYDEIYVCGYTRDQKNFPLHLNEPLPADADLLKIMGFKNPE